VTEPDSNEVQNLLLGGIPVTCRLSEAEIVSGMARRQRAGEITAEDRDLLISRVHRDPAAIYIVEITSEVSSMACRLLRRHKLRAGDALHLASAGVVRSRSDIEIEFVAFDRALNAAAQQEGLILPSFAACDDSPR